MYILECANGAYYTGSTKNLDLRVGQHQNGKGANFTKKHAPVKLVYFEKFQRIDEAFYREKQVQGWSRKKKEALINGFTEQLHHLAECKNESHSRNIPFGSAQGTPSGSAQGKLRTLSGAETPAVFIEAKSPQRSDETETTEESTDDQTPRTLGEAETPEVFIESGKPRTLSGAETPGINPKTKHLISNSQNKNPRI